MIACRSTLDGGDRDFQIGQTARPFLPRQRLVPAQVDVQLIRTPISTSFVRRHAVRRVGFAVIHCARRRTAVDDLHGDVPPGRGDGGADIAGRGDLEAEATVCARACRAVIAGVGGCGVMSDGHVIIVIGRVGGEKRGVDVGAGRGVSWGFIDRVAKSGLFGVVWERSTGTHHRVMLIVPEQCPPEMSGLMSPAAAP